MSGPHHDTQAGIGLVEVIIGMVIALVAITLVAQAVMSSGRSITGAKARAKQAEVARLAFTQLRSDQRWGARGGACGAVALGQRCDVSSLVQGDAIRSQRVDGQQLTFEVAASAVGIDSPADNTAAGVDRDRRVPDWYEITVRVTAPGTLRGVDPLVMTETSDSSSRSTGGVLVVRACAATDQADDRVDLGACSAPRTVPMAGPEQTSGAGDLDAGAWASAPDWARTVRIEPVAVDCTAQGPTGTISLRTGADGSWSAPDGLASGSWTIRCSPPGGLVPWLARSAPQSGVVRVQEGRTAEVLVAFQPAPVEVRIRQATIHFSRYRYVLNGVRTPDLFRTAFAETFQEYDRSASPQSGRLVPAPYGRAPLSWPSGASATGLKMPAVAPGLYSSALLAGDYQHYLYSAGSPVDSLPYNFADPIQWMYVHRDGRVEIHPQQDVGGLWMVRWWCHQDQQGDLPCPGGRVPSGRGALWLGGAGGSGGS